MSRVTQILSLGGGGIYFESKANGISSVAVNGIIWNKQIKLVAICHIETTEDYHPVARANTFIKRYPATAQSQGL